VSSDMVCVELSGLCPLRQGSKIHFWGRSTHRANVTPNVGRPRVWSLTVGALAGRRQEDWYFSHSQFYLT